MYSGKQCLYLYGLYIGYLSIRFKLKRNPIDVGTSIPKFIRGFWANIHYLPYRYYVEFRQGNDEYLTDFWKLIVDIFIITYRPVWCDETEGDARKLCFIYTNYVLQRQKPRKNYFKLVVSW